MEHCSIESKFTANLTLLQRVVRVMSFRIDTEMLHQIELICGKYGTNRSIYFIAVWSCGRPDGAVVVSV